MDPNSEFEFILAPNVDGAWIVDFWVRYRICFFLYHLEINYNQFPDILMRISVVENSRASFVLGTRNISKNRLILSWTESLVVLRICSMLTIQADEAFSKVYFTSQAMRHFSCSKSWFQINGFCQTLRDIMENIYSVELNLKVSQWRFPGIFSESKSCWSWRKL